MRASYWSGQTINGVTYTLTDANTRTASDGPGGEDDETQKVTPDYVEGSSELILVYLPLGTGLTDTDGAQVFWQDVTPRVWAVSA
jgi:hypothetical protein